MTTEVMADREVATRDRLALALDVDDLVEALRLARELRPWFGVAKVGLELYSAVGSRGDRCARRPRLRRVPRPQAARHPDDGAPRRARGRRARRRLPHAARAGRRGDAARRRRRPCRRRRAARACPTPTALAVTVLTSDDGAPAAHPAQAGRRCSRERLRRHRVRGERRARGRALRARGSRSSCPASGRPAPRITIRPAPRHRGRRSTPVPTCSSSDGPSPRRQTRPQPRLPSSHPSPETPEFLANSGSRETRSRQENKRRLSRGPTRESPALGCRPCRILPPVSRAASGRSEEGGRGSHSAGRAQGEAQDGLGHPS